MSRQLSSTREKILDAALTLLEAGQGHGVKMGDIAKHAGISRQAVYLHFASKAELLIAATRHLDQRKAIDQRLQASRVAATGVERLRAFVEAWGNYIPEIYGVAKALLAMRDTDREAATAWDQRMHDMREGCEAAITALANDGRLNPKWNRDTATDFLWTLLSIRNWEHLRLDCSWTQRQYLESLHTTSERCFVQPPH